MRTVGELIHELKKMDPNLSLQFVEDVSMNHRGEVLLPDAVEQVSADVVRISLSWQDP